MSNPILNKVSGSDFFAVIAPGFYSFVALFVVIIALGPNSSGFQSIWKILDHLLSLIEKSPISLIFILFGTYLVGSAFRAIPVTFAERSIPRFKSNFPYPSALNDILDKLQGNPQLWKGDPKQMPMIPSDFPEAIFNFWKTRLCIVSQEGFAYYQSFENRSRFFAGIIWASIVGFGCSIIIFIGTLSIVNPVGIPILLFSLVLFIAFGSNFRRIRRQEARALLLAYLAIKEMEK